MTRASTRRLRAEKGGTARAALRPFRPAGAPGKDPPEVFLATPTPSSPRYAQQSTLAALGRTRTEPAQPSRASGERTTKEQVVTCD